MAQFSLGVSTTCTSDHAAGLRHLTAARDGLAAAGPSPGLALALAFRAPFLLLLGQEAEGAEEARRALDLPVTSVTRHRTALLDASQAATLAGTGGPVGPAGLPG